MKTNQSRNVIIMFHMETLNNMSIVDQGRIQTL